MTCRQQLSTCHEAVLISKYVYSRPTYLYTNIQTFDNVWLKTTVPRDNSERNKHSCACSTLHSTGESCCEFFNTYVHTYTHTDMHACMHTYIHTSTYIPVHTYQHIHTSTYIPAHTYQHIHTSTYIPVPTYQYIHTSTCSTYIPVHVVHTYQYIHTSRYQ